MKEKDSFYFPQPKTTYGCDEAYRNALNCSALLVLRIVVSLTLPSPAGSGIGGCMFESIHPRRKKGKRMKQNSRAGVDKQFKFIKLGCICLCIVGIS